MSPLAKARLKKTHTAGQGVQQTELVLEKVNGLQKSFGRFKSNFVEREFCVAEVDNTVTELVIALFKPPKAPECKCACCSAEHEDQAKAALQRRVHELQRLNNELLVELRTMNARLMAAKLAAQETSPGRCLEHAVCRRCNFSDAQTAAVFECSQLSESREDMEKKQLKEKIFILSKELEAVRENSESRLAEYRKKLDTYLLKLSRASNCINRFLLAMQAFQAAVLKQESHNMEQLRSDFEMEKAQLVKLAKEILNVSLIESTDTSSNSRIARSKTVLHGRRKSNIERFNTSRDCSSPSRRTQSIHKSYQTATPSRSDCVQSSDLLLKRKINKLEALINERDSRLSFMRKRADSTLKSRLLATVRKMEKQTLISLSELSYKVNVERQRLERLKAFVTISTNSYCADQCKSRQLSSPPNAQALENAELSSQLAKLQENYKALAKQNASKDSLLQKKQEIIEELTKNLRTLKGHEESVTGISKVCALQLMEQLVILRDSVNVMLKNWMKDMEVKVENAIEQVNNTVNLLSRYRQTLRKPKLKNYEEINFTSRLEEVVKNNKEQLLSGIQESELKFSALKSIVNKMRNVIRTSNAKRRALDAKNKELAVELASEKLKAKSLERQLLKANSERKDLLSYFSNYIATGTQKIQQSIFNALTVVNEARVPLIAIKVSKFKQELVRKKRIIEGLTKKNNEHKSELSQKEVLLSSLEKSTMDARQQVDDLKAQLLERARAAADMKAEIYALKKAESERSTESDSARDQVDEYSMKVKKSGEENAVTKKQLEEVKSELSTLKNDAAKVLEEKERSIQSMQSEVDKVSDENNALNRLIEELKEKNAVEVDEVRTRLLDEKSQMLLKDKKAEEMKIDHEKQVSELNKKIQDKFKDFIKEKKELEAQRNNLTNELAAKNQQLNSLIVESNKVQELVGEMESLKDKLREKEEEMKGYKDMNKRLSDDLSETQQAMLNLKNQHENKPNGVSVECQCDEMEELRSKDETIAELRKQIEALSAEKKLEGDETGERKFNEMNDAIETLKDQLEEKVEEVEKLKKVNKELMANFSPTTENINEDNTDIRKVKDLQDELTKRDETIDELTKDIETLQILNNDLKLSQQAKASLTTKLKKLVVSCAEAIPLKYFGVKW